MPFNPSDQPTIEHLRPAAPAGAPAPIAIDEVARRFPHLEIIDVLGAGGMGVVYKARQKSLDRLVALKVLPPQPNDVQRHESFAERFTREARALARLQHPNIVTVYDSGAVNDLCYFIMEFVDGSNLRQVMGANAGRLQPSEALAIVPGVCDALEYAHAEGIAHRDIKPENILVDRKGRVKIADFGIAKLLQRPGTDYTLTHTQQIIGTMHYMAPEQIERPSTVDHRADVYSLGVVLYEMLTGELPIGRFPLPSERGVSDVRLDQVVLRALEKEPSRRYQHASEIKTDLQRLNAAPTLPQPWMGQSTLATTPTPDAMSGSEGPVWRRQASQINTPTPQPLFAGAQVTPAPGVQIPTPAPTPYSVPVPGMRNPGIAYLCWLTCFFGFCGVHRFYCGKWISGFIWLLTGGLLFIGQLIDLALIPHMVNKANRLHRPWIPQAEPVTALPSSSPGQPAPRRNWLLVILLIIAIPVIGLIVLTILAGVIIPLLAGARP